MERRYPRKQVIFDFVAAVTQKIGGRCLLTLPRQVEGARRYPREQEKAGIKTVLTTKVEMCAWQGKEPGIQRTGAQKIARIDIFRLVPFLKPEPGSGPETQEGRMRKDPAIS